VADQACRRGRSIVALGAHDANKSKEHMMVVAAKPEVVERSFVNQHGERWLLRIELRSGDAALLGDEADWIRGIQIRNDVVAPDFILADDEARWLATTWFELTGRRLVLPIFNRKPQ
jgi:hypothetical protein